MESERELQTAQKMKILTRTLPTIIISLACFAVLIICISPRASIAPRTEQADKYTLCVTRCNMFYTQCVESCKGAYYQADCYNRCNRQKTTCLDVCDNQ